MGPVEAAVGAILVFYGAFIPDIPLWKGTQKSWIAVYLHPFSEDKGQLRNVVHLAGPEAMALLLPTASNTKKIHSLSRSSLVSSPLRWSHLLVTLGTLSHILGAIDMSILLEQLSKH